MITEFPILNMIHRGKGFDRLSLDIIPAPRTFMFTKYWLEVKVKQEVNERKNDQVKQHLILFASN